jgi:hypothetical protein
MEVAGVEAIRDAPVRLVQCDSPLVFQTVFSVVLPKGTLLQGVL